MILSRSFYIRDTFQVAEELLGKILVHNSPEGITKGRITELEIYMGAEDKASHSYGNKRTARTEIQFREGGYAYVYFIYGMYYCMNIVTGPAERPESVLIRALEPVEGIELMTQRRNNQKLTMLCNGPGKLCAAMGITKEHYGMDLCGDVLYLEDAPVVRSEDFVRTKRINIEYAGEAKEYLWRYVVR